MEWVREREKKREGERERKYGNRIRKRTDQNAVLQKRKERQTDRLINLSSEIMTFYHFWKKVLIFL